MKNNQILNENTQELEKIENSVTKTSKKIIDSTINSLGWVGERVILSSSLIERLTLSSFLNYLKILKSIKKLKSIEQLLKLTGKWLLSNKESIYLKRKKILEKRISQDRLKLELLKKSIQLEYSYLPYSIPLRIEKQEGYKIPSLK